ncbi:hypothetical protein [Lichenifustis flavocetrariae]|uniref:DUF2946 domain-containing protein n=1 Tax=Lichenifustis flavocetrariae TaxID=2949735 RepID=A0AA41YX60_9HYPH|nr:hypothetical protein [Lichenifustis flavocetrariae]MCW6506578.1 hypothetical protein [Lichenifustis flavocetrariae]
MFVLTLAGVGRGFAAVTDAMPSFGIPGIAVHICHTGESDGSAPVDPAHHDCCDACALSAPVDLAAAPVLTGPASVAHFIAHVQAMAWVPRLARLRTPRQSQGPPTA